MRYRLLHIWSALVCFVASTLCCCSTEGQSIDAEYGYVQFRLIKESQLNDEESRASDRLEWLSDAHKISVVMQRDGSTISQTLPLTSYDIQSAEWGVQSEKLRLMTGSYNVIGYKIYDNLDNEIFSGGDAGAFAVVKGGLEVKRIGVPTVKRGIVGFALLKAYPTTRYEAEGDYPFQSIKAVDITVKNRFSNKSTTFKAMPTAYYETFVEGSYDEELYERNGRSSYMICGAQYWLEAGNYVITDYTTYSDSRAQNRLEIATIDDLKVEFSVEDNLSTMVTVPIILSTTTERIKDYEALKEIWLALDGPNWTFHGEEYNAGANWDFNKDVDMWGDQLGVTLNSEGRVVGLNISGFGAKGVVPDAIGQLTELQTLYLGNHNELIGGYDDTTSPRLSAMDYHERMVKQSPYRGMSKELTHALTGDTTTAKRKDVAFGNLTNGITGISRAMMRLTKLEQLFIANSPITADGFFVDLDPKSPFYNEQSEWSWNNFELLSDVEIYNCSKLDRLPIDMLTELPNIISLNIAMNQGISGEQLKSDWEAIIDGESGGDIQILYLGFNNLKETPSHDYLKRMHKISYLDCTYNNIEVVHPFGKEISPATVLFDVNNISRLYAAEDGYFCGLSMLETFSCSSNKLTELPDLFTARSVYGMLTTDFSSNMISSLENDEAWRGLNTGTLNLSNNRFEELPARLMQSGSTVEVLLLSANGMRHIAEGALTGDNSESLTTIDLSYNRLSELPYRDFSISNIPYLYGIDLSYNAFSDFPYAPLSVDRLTVMSIRHQRDDEGNRVLREWPTGLYTHTTLAAFYIGSNDLRKIDDTISPYILLFEIKDNPNISIDLSAVCPYIEMGYYALIYDPWQDIRGCDALNLD